MKWIIGWTVALSTLVAMPLAAQPAKTEDGRVEIPLDIYNQLVEAARDPSRLPRPVPASYALGSAVVNVTVSDVEPKAAAQISVDLTIEVYEDEWVLVPVLPVATPVERVLVAGSPVQLVATPMGLAWATRQSGSHRMNLVYRVDAARSKGGFSLPIPLPEASATTLSGTLPGVGLDVTVIPAAGVRTTVSGSSTRLSATVPTTNGVQIVWRAPTDSGHAISRARYSGELAGEAIVWTGQLEVELFTDETVMLPLLPSSVTLSDLRVDDDNAAILVENGRFVTPVKGRGRHQVVIGFESPVQRGEGPPRVAVQVPAVPVSRFDLTLPGRKEVSVTPAANVTSRRRGEATVATVFAPMTTTISFSWAEAVPDEIRAKVRANASLFHAVHAEEGVLMVRAFALYEVTRGETNQLRFVVPPGVQVNRITSPNGAVADWRIEGEDSTKPRAASVFLDRMVRDQIRLDIEYDRSLGPVDTTEPIVLPLLSAPDVHRQRGMVALLSSNELTLDPVEDGGATRVGENQLPPFVREGLALTVAHTFKYVEAPPDLKVQASVPEREQGRFDAQVDTLISLGEVTLSGSATVEINVKSGGIMDLALLVPAGVNILNLTGPSIRTYRVGDAPDGQRVDVEFTQEMEGQFRLEVSYELILSDLTADQAVPTLSVDGAEVEQGRLAIEALSAVEVGVVRSEQLTALDIGELPQQLVLRTTNPILLAYKYVQGETPSQLVLKVTRHDLLDVQEAAIDRAEYRTLFTRDGLAVTTALFTVRNSRKQFLRIRLPEDAVVWSAFVDGRPEKPAMASDDDGEDGTSVLLKIVNSTRGFPVQLIYATRGSKVRGLGTVEGRLPIPDILVTQSRWDVFLPADMRYREPSTNMDLVTAGEMVSGGRVESAMAGDLEAAAQVIEPLRIAVPTAGIHYAFEKLYANQAQQEAGFSISYASASGARMGGFLSLVATLLMWAGIRLRARPIDMVKPWQALVGALAGLAGLILTIGVYEVSATPAVIATLGVGLLVIAAAVRRWFGSGDE